MGCVYIGICRVEYRSIGNTLTMSIIVGIGAVGAAASSKKLVVVPRLPGRNIVGEQCVAAVAGK